MWTFNFHRGFLCDNIQDGRHLLSGKAIARAVRAHQIVDAALNSLLLAIVLDPRLPRNTRLKKKTLPKQLQPKQMTLQMLKRIQTCMKQQFFMTSWRMTPCPLMRHACLMSWKGSTTFLEDIKSLRRRRPGPPHYGSSIWIWWTSSASTSGLSVLETDRFICWPSRTCYLTWQSQVTTCTPNLQKCIWLNNWAGSHAKPEDQRGPHERERNDEATASAVAAIHACLCRIQQGNARAGRGELQYWGADNDMAKARQARDWRDTLAAVQYIQERNPFSPDPTLQNIATVVHAHTTVNVDTAKNAGTTILQSID